MDNLQIIYLPNTKELKDHYWVYIHTCPNLKYYIGVTHGNKPQIRWGSFGNGYKKQRHFYNAVQKYGWDNILHEAWEVESKEQMYEMEIWLITFFESNNKEYGYNHSAGGEHGCEMNKNSRSKDYMKQYQQTEKRKTYFKEYHQSDEYKVTKKLYRQTDKYKAYQKSYKQTEKYKEKQRQYYQEHKEEYKEKKRLYNISHKDEILEKQRQYRLKKKLENQVD